MSVKYKIYKIYKQKVMREERNSNYIKLKIF